MAVTLSEERKNCVFLAKLAKETGRYEEMFDLMKKVASDKIELTHEEQALLSLAFKKVIEARRSSLVLLSSASPRPKNKEVEAKGRDYKVKIESELSKICLDMMDMIETHLFSLSSTMESTVSLYKMKGDCYRYLAQFKTGSEKKDAFEHAVEAYKKGSDLAKAELSPANHARLGLALNYSVLYYDIMKLPMEAYYLARDALEEVNPVIDNLSKEASEKSNPIMNLLKDNMSLFTSDLTEKDQIEYERRLANQLKLLGGNN